MLETQFIKNGNVKHKKGSVRFVGNFPSFHTEPLKLCNKVGQFELLTYFKTGNKKQSHRY